jgi:hypothetical protein
MSNITKEELHNFMEQSPSCKANRSSASQEIPCILWNLEAHYHIHKHPPPVPILSQIKQRKNTDCKIITFKTLSIKEM